MGKKKTRLGSSVLYYQARELFLSCSKILGTNAQGFALAKIGFTCPSCFFFSPEITELFKVSTIWRKKLSVPNLIGQK